MTDVTVFLWCVRREQTGREVCCILLWLQERKQRCRVRTEKGSKHVGFLHAAGGDDERRGD